MKITQTLAFEHFKQEAVRAIQTAMQRQVPYFAIELQLQNLLNEVKQLAQAELEKDYKAYQEAQNFPTTDTPTETEEMQEAE